MRSLTHRSSILQPIEIQAKARLQRLKNPVIYTSVSHRFVLRCAECFFLRRTINPEMNARPIARQAVRDSTQHEAT